ncbi:MAG: hypothetical protein DPW18_16865 [Chloroflexi bacterium]|nr:hypothetical protein [Chloroflexota bacterium]MDL1911413.1 cyclic nucleotide-binding domain-containing protein [Chloroflexi bacterium CFX6]
MTRLARLLSIKPGEGRMSSFLIGIMLLTAFGAALGGTGIEALFFARFGVDYLPYMYIGLGITSMLTSFLVTAALGRIPKSILYTAVPLLAALLLLGARLVLLAEPPWLYPVLWLGKEVLNSLVNLVIWGVAGVVCDARQAKRLFPLFNASRILGQILGGFATGLLVSFIGAENLLLGWFGSLVLSFLLSRALVALRPTGITPQPKFRRSQPALIQEMQRGFEYVRKSTLMAWIAVSTVFFSILYFSISLPFSRAVTEQFPNADDLAAFLGLFNGFNTTAAFLASLLLANRLFARFGIMLCILAFPVIYLTGFAALILAPFFAVIVAFRFLQMLWLSGIADPAWQTMFNVVPPEKRDQVRAFIGGVPEQAGVFIAGGILIIGEQTLLPGQHYLIGLAAAAVCAFILYQARRGYSRALVEALRAGRPQLFYAEEKPFGGFRQDAAAVRTAFNGLRDPDVLVRRISVEVVGQLSLPEAIPALVNGLRDTDPQVRIASLRALTQSKASSALLDIAASLADPEPDVRCEAVSSLTVLSSNSPALTMYLTPLLTDENAKVSARAALSLLRVDKTNMEAKRRLRQISIIGTLDERIHAIKWMGEWGDMDAFDFLANELQDRHLEPAVKKTILTTLHQIHPQNAASYLLEALRDPSVCETAAQLLGSIGTPVMPSILSALQWEETADGALLALAYLPSPPAKPVIDFARLAVSRSREYHALMGGINSQSGKDAAGSIRRDAVNLLVEALREKSQRYGIRALSAVGLLGDRGAMQLAVRNLSSRDPSQHANGLEALETIGAKWRDVLQPLTVLWENDARAAGSPDWERLFNDEDEWIRDCAHYAAQRSGVINVENLSPLSLMDRILFLKRVPLFENLSSVDLKQVAAIAGEESFVNGEEIAREGEPGDVMYVIVSGRVRVCAMRGGREVEIAIRGEGDYVGEMSIISNEPRMASLVAAGDVRTLCIDQKSFEELLRERPDVSLAIIHELNRRLREASLRG